MNIARLKQIIAAVFIIGWGIFIFNKVYGLADLYYLFEGVNNIVLAGGALANIRITAGYFKSFIILFCLIGSSVVIGQMMLSAWRLKASSFLEQVVLSLGLGLCLWSFFTFVLGLIGLLNGVLFALIFWPVVAFSLWIFIRNNKTSLMLFNKISLPHSYLPLICLIFIVIALLINIICALAPESHYDVMVYQLALPDFYKMHGRIADVPFNFNSYFPQNMNMLYLLSLLVGNDTVAKLLHLFLGLSSAIVLYVFTRKHFSRKVAIAAAAGFYLIPQVAMQSWSALNDLGLTFYVLLNVVCLDNWLEDKQSSGKYLYLAAVFSGFALGIKYASAATVAISAVIILYRYGYGRRQWKKSFYEIGKFAVIVFILILPWWVRNASLTGSPLAPFTVAAQQGAAGLSFKKDVFLADCAYPRSFSLKEFLVSPWLNTLNKSTLDYLAGPLFIFFVPLILIVLIRAKMARKLVFLLFYFSFYYILWRSQTSTWRYLLPALAVLCIPIGYLLYNERFNGFNRGLLKIVFTGILLGNLAVICEVFKLMDPVQVVNGTETKSAYLARSHPLYQYPTYPVMEFINQNTSPESKILLLGESRGYYCQRDYIASTAFDVPVFQKYFKGAKDAGELAQQLSRDGITHILLNEGEFSRLQRQYNIFDFQPRDTILLKGFWRDHCRRVFYSKGVGLYEIY
jgi:hypothetical protein